MALPGGVAQKIKRAKHHIAELQSEIAAFHDSSPYMVLKRIDSETGDDVWQVLVYKRPPPEIATIVGDIIHNLRSALDHLMAALVSANQGKVTNSTEFPIFASDSSYQTKAGGKVSGASQPAIDLIDALKPYKGGNDGLWRIHKLDITDKHRQLVTVLGSYERLNIDFGSVMRRSFPDFPGIADVPPMVLGLRPARRCPVNDADEVYRVPAKDREVHDDPTFTFDVALNEPGVVECEPVVPAMQQLIDLIEGLVKPFLPLLQAH